MGLSTSDSTAFPLTPFLHAALDSTRLPHKHIQLVVRQQPIAQGPDDQPSCSGKATDEVDVSPPGIGLNQKESRQPTFEDKIGDILIVFSVRTQAQC
jgi:hypothetical protein